MIKIDNDLQELREGVTNRYKSMRDPKRGEAQILIIQSLRDLKKTLDTSNIENKKLSTKIYWLTITTVLLALIQLITGILQIRL